MATTMVQHRGGLAPPADHWAKTALPLAPWPPGPLQQGHSSKGHSSKGHSSRGPLQQWYWAPASRAMPLTAWMPVNQAPYAPIPPPMFFPMACPQNQPATPARTPAPQAAMPIPPPPPPAHFPPPLPPTQAPLQAPEAPPTAHHGTSSILKGAKHTQAPVGRLVGGGSSDKSAQRGFCVLCSLFTGSSPSAFFTAV
ncbi:unnamed protein product [Symbiodinium natans]|uniref:Uncharacterized protein n=1 Tax=Symbiodinium natans TaxID=878477 RepID=A0A812JTF1_9DINO|nr:unnamed protein product [Symbiodinium natans]